MPRPTQQTFARQLGLQAIMWGLFGAALLGAWQLSQSRSRGLQIPPLGPAKRFAALLIRVPRGWVPLFDQAQTQLTANEPADNQLRRQLIITQDEAGDGPPDLGELLHHAAKTTSIEFKGLGVTGQLAQGRFEDEATRAVLQEYDAVAVLPNNLVVSVELRGVPGFGPIDRADFQSIVDALQLAP